MGRRLLGRPRLRSKENFERILINQDGRMRTGFSWHMIEIINESFKSTKGGDFLDYLSDN